MAPRAEPQRDRWGRYMIPGPKGGKPKGMTRVTTIAKTLSDTHALTEWSKRVVATGIARRPDLIAQAANLTKDDKGPLREIIAAAEEIGGASERRNLGTALHSILEFVDLGQDVTVPPNLEPHVAAYRAAMEAAGVEIIPEFTEVVLANHALGYAGTADRIVRIPGAPRPLIADLKTGKDPLAFGAGEISMQLAAYAHAERTFSFDTQSFGAIPEVDQDWGLIIHLNADPEGAPECTLHLVALDPGWQMLQTALEVREWRKRKDLHRALADHDFGAATDRDRERRKVLRSRLNQLADHMATGGKDRGQVLERIAGRWPAGVPGFGDDHEHTTTELDAIEAVLDQLEAATGAPFPDTTAEVIPMPTRTNPDNGPNVSLEDTQAMRARIGEMAEEQRDRIGRWMAEASPAWPEPPTTRRFEIVRACWLARDLDEDTFRHLLSVAFGEEVQPAWPIGSVLSAMTLAELSTLSDLAAGVAGGSKVVSFDRSGNPAVEAA